MIEKFKEPRAILCLVVYFLGFLPCISINYEMDAMGIDTGSATKVNVFPFLTHTISGFIVLLLPIAMLIVEFMLREKIQPRVIYIIGGILGVIGMFLSTILYKSVSVKSENEYASAEVHSTYEIGFWLEILVFVAIFVITLIKDFALNKALIEEKGLAGALSDVANQVANEAISVTNEIKTISRDDFDFNTGKETVTAKITCASCGTECAVGKKFCSKCGAKLDFEASNDQYTTNSGKSEGSILSKTAKPKTEITVIQYLSKVKDVECENCGVKVGVGVKFCPDCGNKIVIKIPPKNCESCGAQLIPGKKFCADCGEKIVRKELQTNCSNCNADLYYGKKFCVECGTKVSE